jgi:hypothetical protein
MATELAHKLKEGTVIAFTMGGNYDVVKVATVRSVEVNDNYVTVWFRENGKLGMFFTDKYSSVELFDKKAHAEARAQVIAQTAEMKRA